MIRRLIFSISLFVFPLSQLQANDELQGVLQELFKSALTCAASQALKKDMPHSVLYEKQGEQCVWVDPSGDGVFYDNVQCQGPQIVFNKTSFDEFCEEIVTTYKDKLGNADSWAGKEHIWTLNPATRLGLGTLSIRKNHNPYMTKVRYKSVPVRDYYPLPDGGEVQTLRGMGTCNLEMRIYKKDIADTNLKPLLALHGGAWKYRGSAYVGFESEMSHFTERGFVVFVPFYRLVDTVDGNYECNHATWQEIVSDVEDALSWVQQNGAEYGAAKGKVAVMGGSAGGHLAGWLTVNRTKDIERVLLFYPPTDFQHYILDARQRETPLKGQGFMLGYLGAKDLASVDPNGTDVLANSFTQQVVKNPAAYPPVAMVHGVSDTLVPSIQSVRLCNALNGDIENGPAIDDGGDPTQGVFSKEYVCGDRGHMYLVAEGDHGLDSCVEQISCPAGSKGSQEAVRKVLNQAMDWLAE